MRHPVYHFLSFIMITATIAGCTPSSCFEDTDAFLNGGFYATGSGKVSPPDSLSVSSIPGSNLIFYNKALKTGNISLLLDPTDTETAFLFVINGVKDTVTVLSESYPFLVSGECGFSWHHKILSVESTHHIIDTVLIDNKNVTLANEENIRIFY